MRDDEFGDEHTPLPTIPGIVHDPEFPTGRIPRIQLGQLHLSGADSLYPRWSVDSACASPAELVELFAPHFEDTSLWLFPSVAPPDRKRVALEIITRDGARALAGIVDVIECTKRGPYERLALRVRFLSIDRSSSPSVLRMTASGDALRALLDGGEAVAPAHHELAAVRDDRTTRMSRIELADLMGASLDELHGWDARLACELRELPHRAPDDGDGDLQEESDDDDSRPTQPIAPPPEPLALPLTAPPSTVHLPRLVAHPRRRRMPRWIPFALLAIVALGGVALLRAFAL